MQELEQIPIGQQDNDGTGDPLRNGMAKVNANFTKVQAGVDAVELTAANAAQTATEAKTTADAAIPAAQKGMAGGVAPLDASGKVPATHLPELADYIPVEEKGAAEGVAPLDAGTKVPVANLPVGTAGGVAPLGADGKVPAVNLPAAEDSIPLSQKGQPGAWRRWTRVGRCPPPSCLRSLPARRSVRWHGGRCARPSRQGRSPPMGRPSAAPPSTTLPPWWRPARCRWCPKPTGWPIRSNAAVTPPAMDLPLSGCRISMGRPLVLSEPFFSEVTVQLPTALSRGTRCRATFTPQETRVRPMAGFLNSSYPVERRKLCVRRWWCRDADFGRDKRHAQDCR